MHISRGAGMCRGVVAVFLCAATSLSAQTRDPVAIATALDARIVSAARGGGPFAGLSVLMLRGRDTLIAKTYGKTDLAGEAPTPTDAVYEVASVTKQFTAAAILLLQEQGKLSLSDPLTRWLPNAPTSGRRVTIRHLLEHTSGLTRLSIEDPEFKSIMAQALPRDTLIAIYGRKPIEFEPGSAMSYSNFAYILLGHVIEKASGMSYADLVKRQLFDRAGMRHSRYCTNGDSDPRRAKGYDVVQGALAPSPHIDHRWGFAAGSLCSTAGDLVAWTQALHGGRILSAASYKELMTPGALDDGTTLRYTKGLQLFDIAGHRSYAHGGGVYGFSAAVAYLPDDSVTLVALMNTRGPFSAAEVATTLVRTVLGEKTSPVVAFRGSTDDYIGEYRGAAPGQVFTIGTGDAPGTLTLSVNGGGRGPLVYRGEEIFERGGSRLTFIREGGRVSRLRYDAGTVVAIATRTHHHQMARATGGEFHR